MNIRTVYTHLPEYEEVRDRLYCRLFNPGIMTGYTESFLSRPWMDLALCCYFEMTMFDEPGAVPVRRYFLSDWNVTEEKVFSDAWHNTEKRERIMFCSLEELLRELAAGEADGKAERFPEDCPLYILSSKERQYGAVYMASPAVLRQIARHLERNFYILPSSIHECLILPELQGERAERLNGLVRSVNSEIVEENEILSDHVYYYDGKTGTVRIY